MTGREQQVVDAAISVLADGGVRQLTHRAVDARAAVPAGSTSNRFRSRETLLAGVLRRLLEREEALWTQSLVGVDVSSIEVFAATLGGLVEELTGPSHGQLTRARHAVVTQAELGSELRTELALARQRIGTWMRPLLTVLGSADPDTHLAYLLALLDGLLLGRLAESSPQPRPSVAIAALLHGLLRPGVEAVGPRLTHGRPTR